MKKSKILRMKLYNWTYVLAACFLLCAIVACGNSGNQPEDTGKQEERDAQEGVGGQEDRDVSQNAAKQDTDSFVIADLAGSPSDYAQEENWLKIPEITHEVDTFYLYPTCYIDEAEDAVEYVPAALFGPESLHAYDYNLYYENLRENVKARVEAFLKTR